MAKPLRRPGSPWRILAHTWTGKKPDGPRYGDSWHIDNTDPGDGGSHTAERIGDTDYWTHTRHLPGTEFDELVIGEWIHLEQQSGRQWAIHIGGVRIGVTADRDGRPTAVDVYGPGDYLPPVDGCTYDITWTDQ